MEAVGRRRLPWFIGGGLCVLPRALTEVKRVPMSPTPHEKLVDEGVSSCCPLRMLVRKPPVPWCNFSHHLGVGRAWRSSGRHG
jgi:hypothetical protein